MYYYMHAIVISTGGRHGGRGRGRGRGRGPEALQTIRILLILIAILLNIKNYILYYNYIYY